MEKFRNIPYNDKRCIFAFEEGGRLQQYEGGYTDYTVRKAGGEDRGAADVKKQQFRHRPEEGGKE